MPDREKVTGHLNDCLMASRADNTWVFVRKDIVVDALALLKEQEAKWIHREDMDFIDKYNCTHFHGMCTNCGLVHDFIDGHTGQYLYCPQCGKRVKWE